MTTGWPQDQHDLRWPYAEDDDAGPGSSVRGRLATDTDPRAAEHPAFSSDHPSGPLPVGPMRDPRQDRPQRGRLGRKARAERELSNAGDAVGGDADYDWIKYLGEAGPAQESGRRPADPIDRSTEPAPKRDDGPGRRRRSQPTAGPAPVQPPPARTPLTRRPPDRPIPDRTADFTRPDSSERRSDSGVRERPQDSGVRDQPRDSGVRERPQDGGGWDRPQHSNPWDRPQHSNPWDRPQHSNAWATESAWPETTQAGTVWPAAEQP
jgi:hypothetical protein